jgi:hypothetical protein
VHAEAICGEDVLTSSAKGRVLEITNHLHNGSLISNREATEGSDEDKETMNQRQKLVTIE